jgi:hypothetical protein
MKLSPMTASSSKELLKVIHELGTQNQIDWLLLDIGGVLFPDPWQTLILTPDRGLMDRLNAPGLPAAAERLWPKFSSSPLGEKEYWTELSRQSGVDIPVSMVEEVEHDLLVPLPWASALLASPIAHKGIVSDNTAFWFKKQAVQLELDQYTMRPLLLSFQERLRKKDRPRGLFEIAAELTATGKTLVVDDHVPNVIRAEEAGLFTLHIDLKEERGGRW